MKDPKVYEEWLASGWICDRIGGRTLLLGSGLQAAVLALFLIP